MAISMVFGFVLLRAEPGICIHSESQMLEAPAATDYQWYRNGLLIVGETHQAITVRQSGVYTVSYSDRFGLYAEEGVRVEVSEKKIVRVFLIGDSTVADYTIYDDYKTKRYPITGWGQVFQSFMRSDSLIKYPWADGKLTSVHGEYPDAVKQVAGAFEAYPNGQKDNTHFQPAGAIRVARLVFGALQGI
ncbi:MAG: family lipase [Bacteroidetes bacterium]|nr:family lipase [Bacteroidota bacterium]